jgi:hypothetical protein
MHTRYRCNQSVCLGPWSLQEYGRMVNGKGRMVSSSGGTYVEW